MERQVAKLEFFRNMVAKNRREKQVAKLKKIKTVMEKHVAKLENKKKINGEIGGKIRNF